MGHLPEAATPWVLMLRFNVVESSTSRVSIEWANGPGK
jgi:hypothetical protein